VIGVSRDTQRVLGCGHNRHAHQLPVIGARNAVLVDISYPFAFVASWLTVTTRKLVISYSTSALTLLMSFTKCNERF
jgi:hypothetical protein